MAPLIIEDTFKELCYACSNIMVVGENKKFLSALITLKVLVDPETGNPTKELSSDAINYFKSNLSVDVKTAEEALVNEKIQKFIADCV